MIRFQKVFPLLIFMITVSARLIPGPRTIDDSYITFRYARNVLSGDGFVYNPGERVLGTTTPLYGGLLAALGVFTGGGRSPFPEVAYVLNAFLDGLTVLLLVAMGKRTGYLYASYAVALIWSVLPFSVTFAIGGLETSFFCFLLTAAALLRVMGKSKLTWFIIGLGILTRPEAVILGIGFGIDRGVSYIQRLKNLDLRSNATFRSILKEALAETSPLLIPVFGWVIFSIAYYGSPLPNSVAAKAAAYQIPADAAFVRFLQHYATPLMDNITFGVVGIGVGLVFYPFFFLIGARGLRVKTPEIWPWLIFPWVYFAFYAIANPLVFRWYLTPPLTPYLFGIFCGIQETGRRLLQSVPQIKRVQKMGIGVLILLPWILPLRAWTLNPDHGLQRPAPQMAWYKLELVYLEAARFILTTGGGIEADDTIAVADIGAVGYETNARILDTLGLISPESVDYYPTRPEYHVNAYAVAPDLILDKQPDFLILLEVYGREGLFKNEEFKSQFTLLHTIPTDIYESRGMLIFHKNHRP